MNILEKYGIAEERYNSIMASGQQTVVEVEVSDPVERKKILDGFQSRFNVEVVEHLHHECSHEIFCMKFMATVAQSNVLMGTFLVCCSDHKSRMYQYSNGQIIFCSHDGKGVLNGDLFKLLRKINDPQSTRSDRKHIKQALSAMDVYFPLEFDDENHRELSHLDFMKGTKNVEAC